MRKYFKKATVMIITLSLVLSYGIGTFPEKSVFTVKAASAADMGTRTMNVGETITLTNPAGTSSMAFYAYTWSSSDRSIATTSSGSNNRNSVITALKPGTVTIYGYLDGSLPKTNYGTKYNSITKRWESYSYVTYSSTSYEYKWTITVQGTTGNSNTSNNTTNGASGVNTSTPPSSSSSSSSSSSISPKLTVKKSLSLKRGKMKKLNVKRRGRGKISYKSSNKKIATVSSQGKIKGKKKGKVTITVKVKANGNYKGAVKKVKVTVK